jgi:hypothetical protein
MIIGVEHEWACIVISEYTQYLIEDIHEPLVIRLSLEYRRLDPDFMTPEDRESLLSLLDATATPTVITREQYNSLPYKVYMASCC